MDVLEKSCNNQSKEILHLEPMEVHPTLHIEGNHSNSYQPGKVQHNHEKLKYLLAILGDMLDKDDQMLATYTEAQKL